VHGRLATLFRVKDKKHFLALSELVGNKLGNIVIDNQKVGADLLKG
jgi:chromosome segregation ATPase